MAWRPHPKRARTNSSSPDAWGTSDRSGFVGNQKDLLWQLQWGGTKLINQKILVYADEYDKPQEQLKAIILPPDPISILNARPEPYQIDELWEMMMEQSTQEAISSVSNIPAHNVFPSPSYEIFASFSLFSFALGPFIHVPASSSATPTNIVGGYDPGYGGGSDNAPVTPLKGGAWPIYLEQTTVANSGQPTMALSLEINTPPGGNWPATS